MGSKSRIAKHIAPIIQKYIDDNNIDTYYEPMCGGLNMLDKIHCKNRIGSDLNKYLIALLQRVQNRLPLLESVSKEIYDETRTAFNNGDTSAYDDWYIGNICFLASYNGRDYSGGYAQAGYEKTKTGTRYRDYYQESKRNIEKQADAIQGIELIARDYREFTPHGMVVYVDPPYANTKQFANSGHFDYEEFWQTMREWSKDNIVLISEENAPDDFECIWEQEVSRSIKATDKSRSTEKLFKYKGE